MDTKHDHNGASQPAATSAPLESALRRAEARAEAAERQLRSQAILMAECEHKLKTRLTVIGGWATVLAEGWPEISDGDKLTGIRTIKEHADGLSRDTEWMLDELRAEIESGVLTPEVIELAPLLRLSQRDWDRGTRHTVAVRCPDQLAVVADPGALTQLLGHLLENAVKYSPAGGSIELTAVLELDRSEAPVAELRVSDNGMGIPDDIDLFAPFQRGPAAGLEGSGIGLYIVRKLTEAMDGTVTAERNPDRGSSFVVRLPAAARP